MKYKYGFSLMEACIVMLIAAIFMVVIANVIPRKVSPKSMAEAHGRFECYYDENGTLWQEEFYAGASTTGAPVNVVSTYPSQKESVGSAGQRPYCQFSPNKFAKYYIINAVGEGGTGLAARGGNAGKFSSNFYPTSTKKYKLFPGYTPQTGANSYSGNTYAKVDNNVVISVASGSNISKETISADDIAECRKVNQTAIPAYACGHAVTCEIVGEQVKITYCPNAATSTVKYLDIKNLKRGQNNTCSLTNTSVCDYKSLMSNPWTEEPNSSHPNSFIYHDASLMVRTFNGNTYTSWVPDVTYEWLPSLYTLELVLKSEAQGTAGAKSKMATMATSFQFSKTIKTAGNGGDAGVPAKKGKPGAVVIEW